MFASSPALPLTQAHSIATSKGCLLISFSVSGVDNAAGPRTEHWRTPMHLKHSQITRLNASIWNFSL